MTSSDILRHFQHLDKSSSGFHDELNNILCGEEYRQCVPILQGHDLAWLVDYLDELLLILPALLSGSVFWSSEVFAAGIGSMSFASGGFGDICEGIFDGTRVCVKRVRVYSKGSPEMATKALYQEAVVWKRLVHPNIVPLLGVTFTPLQLVSEWIPGGGLTEYVKRNAHANRLGLLSDIAAGLGHLHSLGVIHGDLKGSGILVDKSGHARIADFGLATVAQGRGPSGSEPDERGPATRWTAPEILNSNWGAYSKRADIFSFGMVMIEAFTGVVPFNDLPAAATTFSVMEGRRPPRPSHPSLTDELWELVQRCWDQDPHSRPDVSEVLKVLRDADPPAWERLISPTLGAQERVSLITTIFSENNGLELVRHLRGQDAQAFVDAVDKELDSLEPRVRRRCMRYLCWICGRQGLIPRSLEVEVHYDQKEHPLCNGGFADVWKGRRNGREVAVKVLRVYLTSDLERIRKRFCKEVMTWKSLRHPNVLPLLGVMVNGDRLAMISEWMVNGSINEFVKTHADANRLMLLRDVARGLVYMHGHGIVHGDLKGANVLIDNNGHARLSDFSLITIISDQSTFPSSCIEGGTVRWMSPELLDPGKFGLKESRPTKESDCYALGMVIYEVLSGQKPFAQGKGHAVIRMVMDGERPRRPRGKGGRLFTDGIWNMAQLCWKPQPEDRTNAKAVLLSLEEGLPSPRPFSVEGDGVDVDGGDQSDAASTDSGLSIKRDDELLVLPQDLPHRATTVASGLATTCNGKGLRAPLRLGGSQYGSVVLRTLTNQTGFAAPGGID